MLLSILWTAAQVRCQKKISSFAVSDNNLPYVPKLLPRPLVMLALRFRSFRIFWPYSWFRESLAASGLLIMFFFLSTTEGNFIFVATQVLLWSLIEEWVCGLGDM